MELWAWEASSSQLWGFPASSVLSHYPQSLWCEAANHQQKLDEVTSKHDTTLQEYSVFIANKALLHKFLLCHQTNTEQG